MLCVLQSGFGLGDIAGGFTDLLSAAFADLVSFLVAFVNALYGALLYVWQVLVMVANFLYNALVTLVNHLRAIATWIHEKLLSKIIEWVSTIQAKLHAIFDPIISVLRKIKALQDWYFQNVLKPFLNFIQRLRSALLIFRVLHFKFATQLDAYLAQQEAKITRAFLDVQIRLNQVINWLNLIVYPLLWWSQNRSLTDQEKTGQASDVHHFELNSTRTRISLRAAGGLTPEDTALREGLHAEFADLGFNLP